MGEDDQRILWLSYVNTSLLSITLAVWLCSRLAGALLGEQISSGHLISMETSERFQDPFGAKVGHTIWTWLSNLARRVAGGWRWN